MGCGGKKSKVKETEAEKTVARIAMEQLDRYDTVLAPFEDTWIEGNKVTEGDKQLVSGAINANVQQAGSAQQANLNAQQAAAGIDEGSGRNIIGDTNMQIAKADALGKSQAAGGLNMENRDIQGKMAGVNLLRGNGLDAMGGMISEANRSSDREIADTINEENTRRAFGSSIASGLGAGAAIYTGMPKKTEFDQRDPLNH